VCKKYVSDLNLLDTNNKMKSFLEKKMSDNKDTKDRIDRSLIDQKDKVDKLMLAFTTSLNTNHDFGDYKTDGLLLLASLPPYLEALKIEELTKEERKKEISPDDISDKNSISPMSDFDYAKGLYTTKINELVEEHKKNEHMLNNYNDLIFKIKTEIAKLEKLYSNYTDKKNKTEQKYITLVNTIADYESKNLYNKTKI
jgi:hypothetical protein